MILFLGAALAPPLVALINVYILLMLVVGGGVLLQWLGYGGSLFFLLPVAVVGLLVVLIGASWHLLSRSRILFPINYHAPVKGALSPGPKGEGLRQLILAGVNVAPGFYVPSKIVDRIAAAGSQAKHHRSALRKISRRLVKTARAYGVKHWIVRSSFNDETAPHLYPGVFTTIKDVAAGNPNAITAAILQVIRSNDSDMARAYRKKLSGQKPHTIGAVLIQTQIQHSIWGVISSMDPAAGGRTDRVLIEFTRPDDTTKRVHYIRPLRKFKGSEKVKTISHTVLSQMLTSLKRCEQRLQGPVALEFGVAENTVFYYQIRPMSETAREIWINTGYIELNPEPLPLLMQELTYGINLSFLKRYLRRSLLRKKTGVQLGVKLINARPYVCLNDLQKSDRTMGATPPKQVRFRKATLVADLPDGFPLVDQIAELRRLLIRQSNLKSRGSVLMAREAYVHGLGSKEAPTEENGWKIWLARIFKKQAIRSLKTADALHESITAALANLTRQLTERAEGSELSAFLSLEEIGAISKGQRGPTINELQDRQTAFDEAAHRPASAMHPPIKETGRHRREEGHLGLNALTSGSVSARGFMPTSPEDSPEEGSYVLLLPDMSLKWQKLLVHADGVVFASESTLSHLALQAMQQEIPAVTAAEPEDLTTLSGRNITVDANTGTVKWEP